MDLTFLDDGFYLMGDKFSGVSLVCTRCGDGVLEMTIAYYSDDDDRTYVDDPDVEQVARIVDLLKAGLDHVLAVHPEVVAAASTG